MSVYVEFMVSVYE